MDYQKLVRFKIFPSVKSYHLSIENKNGKLIYNRKLREGSGESLRMVWRFVKTYGLWNKTLLKEALFSEISY